MATTWRGNPPIVTPRTRETDLIGKVTSWGRNTYKQGTGTRVETTLNIDEGFRTGFKRTTTDVVVPQFAARSAKGEIFNNSFYTVLSERKDSGLPSWSWTYLPANPPEGAQIVGEGGNTRGTARDVGDHITYPFPEVDVDSLVILAGTQAFAGVAEPEFDTPVFMAEFSETWEYLARPMGGLRDFMKKTDVDFRRRHGKSFFQAWQERSHRISQEMSDTWLAFRYGIKPVLGDIESALKILSEEPTHRPRYTSRGVATSGLVQEVVQTEDIRPVDAFWKSNLIDTRNVRVTARAGVLYEHEISMRSRLGLNVSELPRAAWNAIPLSHVADWIWNVEDLLGALEHKVGVNILTHWTTVTTRREKKFEVWSTPRANVTTYVLNGGTNHTKWLVETIKDRTRGAAVGLAKKPQLFDLSQEKWRNRTLDAVAFVTKTYFGRKR